MSENWHKHTSLINLFPKALFWKSTNLHSKTKWHINNVECLYYSNNIADIKRITESIDMETGTTCLLSPRGFHYRSSEHQFHPRN